MTRRSRRGSIHGTIVLCAVLCAALARPCPAAAQDPDAPIGVEQMRRDMHHYFDGEYAEGWVFLGTGLAAGGTGAYLLTLRDDLASGAAIPVLAVGAIQLAAGLVLLFRTGPQVAELDAQLDDDPAAYRDAERERMAGVNAQFDVLKYTEIGLAVAGAATFGAGLGTDEDWATGIGAGLAIQAAVMLVLDLIAEARADDYTDSLERFEPQ